MIVLKIIVIVLFVLLTVLLGAGAGAWKRACLFIAHNLAVSRWMKEGFGPFPTIRQLPEADVIRYTPKWVSARYVVALVLLALTFLLSILMFRWYVSFGITVGTYILMELAAFSLANSRDPYYVRQILDTFKQELALAQRFKDDKAADDLQNRIKEIEAAYPVNTPGCSSTSATSKSGS